MGMGSARDQPRYLEKYLNYMRRDKLANTDFSAPSEQVARELIGASLQVDGVCGRVMETEGAVHHACAQQHEPGLQPV
jgi:hypothetical protein